MTGVEKHTPGTVSRLPLNSGDGYSWGGEWFVSFGPHAFCFGPEREDLAHLCAAAPELLEALQAVLREFEANSNRQHRIARIGYAAIAKATQAPP